jgi:hypothetical protein
MSILETVESDANAGSVEHIPATEPERPGRWHQVAQRAGRIALGAVRFATPPLIGAAAASWIALQPAEVDLGVPGIAAEATIQNTDYFTAQYGPTKIGLEGPGNYRRILGQDISVNLEITQLDTSAHKAGLEQSLAGLIGSGGLSGVKQKLMGVITGPVARQIYFGGGIGFGIFAGIATGMKARRKRHSRTRSETSAELDHANSHIELLKDLGEPEGKSEHIAKLLDNETARKEALEAKLHGGKHRLRQKIGAYAAGLALMAVSAKTIANEFDSLQPPDTGKHYVADALSQIDMGRHALQEYPLLKHVFITGDAGYYSDQAVAAALSYMNRYNTGWKTNADYFTQVEVPRLETIIPQELQNNPDIVRITTIADVHDNQPELKEAMAAMLEGLGTDLVLNLGDQESNGGHSFLDFGAWLRAANALPEDKLTGKTTPELLAPGNHDHDNYQEVNNVTFTAKNGSKYQPIIPLDKQNNYSAEFEGIPIVGSPDLNATGVNGTFPQSTEAQIANDAKQGELLAQRACETYKNTGKKPILIAHEQWATFKAIAEGCVSFAASGHGHEQMPLKALQNPDGSISFQWTIGSSSGDGPNNAINVYNLPTITGYMVTWLFDKKLNMPVGAIVTRVYPNKTPTVDYVGMPNKAISPLQDPLMHDFFDANDPEQLQQLERAQAQKQLLMTPR